MQLLLTTAIVIANVVGVAVGPAVAGNIGHARRLGYTVIGDAVNED